MFRETMAVILALALMTSGCASATRQVRTEPPRDPALLAAYVQRLPIGSRVRARLAGGGSVNGSLMKADDRVIVIQPHTRLPEPPVELPLDRIAAVELETGGNPGRTVGIAVAAGVGGALAFFLILAAIYAGD